MSGIDIWKMAADLKQREYNRFSTTKEVLVDKTKRSSNHDENGIAVVLHKFSDTTVLEVRGFDDGGNRFSYKFKYGVAQPLAMRAVTSSGEVEKLNVSLAKEKAHGITLRRYKPKEEESKNV